MSIYYIVCLKHFNDIVLYITETMIGNNVRVI